MARPTDTEQLRQLNALLETALDLPPARRGAWLDQLPPQHSALVPQLRSLLERANMETDQFLRQSAHASVGALHLGADHAGQVIGPWRLLAELGQGGTSTVWRAERCDGGLERDVALKLPHAGWAHSIAQRMAQERDILASLEHPAIARLYDAGLTSQGRPWLAMELVDGVTIDRFCRGQRLGIEARLRLFLQVAAAVAYAHAQLVVHRDLKPGNILVTPEGSVRLLDFGVAKLLAQDSQPERHLTREIGRPMTPDYASPEMVGMQSVGTTADVYSLGIVLFELLSEHRPCQSSGMAALQDASMSAEAPLASSRAPDAATRRALRGDLDNIIVKALQRVPTDRYTSVEAFAADIGRYLEGLPVLARPPLWRYRAAKFVRRHRWSVAWAAVVGVSLLTGLGAALWQADVARAEAARAEQVKQFIASIFQQAKPRTGEGGVVTASDLLAAAAQRIESELAGHPRVAAELGVMVAEGFTALGEPAKSEAPLRAALARGEPVVGRQHPMVLLGKVLLADSIDEQDVDAALRVLADVLPDLRAGMPGTAKNLVNALQLESLSLARKNRAEPAIAALNEAIAVAEQHLGPAHELTLRAIGLLANTHGRFGQRTEHLRVATQAMERAAALQAKRPDNTLTAVERWYAEALRANDRPADAIPILRRVLQDQRTLDAAPTPRVRNALVQLAVALDGAGEQSEGLRLMREAVALEAVHNPKDSEDRLAFVGTLAAVLTASGRIDEAMALNLRLAGIEQQLGKATDIYGLSRRVREARGLAMQADFGAAARAAAAAAEQAGDRFAQQRAEAWIAAALNARLSGDPAQALKWAQQALSDPKAAGFRITVLAAATAEQGLARLDLGDLPQARLALRQSMEQYSRAQIAPSPRMAHALIGMARLHLQDGQATQAQALLAPLVQAWEQVHPGSAWHGEALHWSALALGRMGRHEEAARQRKQAREMLRASALPSLQALAAAPVTVAAK
jgi:eukaryotic-like serine/threonine-protein kinase